MGDYVPSMLTGHKVNYLESLTGPNVGWSSRYYSTGGQFKQHNGVPKPASGYRSPFGLFANQYQCLKIKRSNQISCVCLCAQLNETVKANKCGRKQEPQQQLQQF